MEFVLISILLIGAIIMSSWSILTKEESEREKEERHTKKRQRNAARRLVLLAVQINWEVRERGVRIYPRD